MYARAAQSNNREAEFNCEINTCNLLSRQTILVLQHPLYRAKVMISTHQSWHNKKYCDTTHKSTNRNGEWWLISCTNKWNKDKWNYSIQAQQLTSNTHSQTCQGCSCQDQTGHNKNLQLHEQWMVITNCMLFLCNIRPKSHARNTWQKQSQQLPQNTLQNRTLPDLSHNKEFQKPVRATNMQNKHASKPRTQRKALPMQWHNKTCTENTNHKAHQSTKSHVISDGNGLSTGTTEM